MDYDKLLNMGTELGRRLMSSGAEIYRVEESIFRLLRAYGLEEPQVFAIPNALIVSVATPEGHPITRMCRIPGHGTDIELLERCNDLCRRLCTQTPPLEEAQAQVSALREASRTYKPWQAMLGHGLAAAFFTLVFAGSLRDGLCAFLCGLAVWVFLAFGGRLVGANRFFHTVVCAAAASLCALALVRLGLGQSFDAITIGALMLLVPGMALTLAMREIMAGDIISGLSRTAEAILVGAAIALGAVVGLAVAAAF